MTVSIPPVEPYTSRQQERTAHAWWRLVRDRDTATATEATRPVIGRSWTRTVDAQVDPTLAVAPIDVRPDRLAERRAQAAWLPAVDVAANPFHQAPEASADHVLALFDATGCMLDIRGDAAAIDALATINFRPGARWSETAVGTNGPGTALATGQPVHVVGAEHYCERWQQWHCAAVPVRDPLDGAILGVVDISGEARHAHPHTLMLASVVSLSIEQWLRARDAQRRVALLEQLDTLAQRYPGDALVAIDRGGQLVGRRGGWPARFEPADWPAASIRTLLQRGVPDDRRPRPIALDVDGRWPGMLHPLSDPPAGDTDGVVVLTAPARRSTPVPPGGRPGLALRARRTTHYSLSDLLGDSASIDSVRQFVQSAARSKLPVLLTGESGTGKEVVAQSIHAASVRAHEPFVAVNCAAIPRELVESELFGHVAGAFSGARRDGAVGRFEAAHRGTLFLDEIGELPPSAQAALLRALQEGEVTRLGASDARPIDVRVIAATNRDVAAAVAAGVLRDDLYYRLAVLTAELPPLRERRSDIPALAHAFLRDAEREHGEGGHEVTSALLDCLRRHDWPGNVRELRNLMRRVVALADGPLLGPELLPASFLAGARALTRAPARDARGDQSPAVVAGGSAAAGALSRDRIVDALEQCPTVLAAANRLGVSRATLYRALERHGLAASRTVRERTAP